MAEELLGKFKVSDFGSLSTAVALDAFHDFGSATSIGDEKRPAGSLDPDFLFKQGKFHLELEADGRRPTPAQRQTWENFVANAGALSEAILDACVAEYQLQRPPRIKWWKAVYGDHPFDQDLPEVADAREMKNHIRPIFFKIWKPANHATADISITFLSTWCRDGFGVIIRDGVITDAGSGGISAACANYDRIELQHPVMGRLRQMQKGQPWVGMTRVEGVEDFHAIAQERALPR